MGGVRAGEMDEDLGKRAVSVATRRDGCLCHEDLLMTFLFRQYFGCVFRHNFILLFLIQRMFASQGMRNFFDQLQHFWGQIHISGCDDYVLAVVCHTDP
jgi:hypothetical protein